MTNRTRRESLVCLTFREGVDRHLMTSNFLYSGRRRDGQLKTAIGICSSRLTSASRWPGGDSLPRSAKSLRSR